MPRFPDYVAQEGLDVPSAPQIEANTAVGKSLTSLGNTLEEAGQRLAERQRQQAAFDDQIAYQRYTLGQDQALQQAQAGMAPQATGFHDAVMAGRAQADGDFLQTVSPANRDRYAGLLALDRDRTSFAAACMEFEGRGAYEQAAFGQSVSDMADQVRASPNLLPSALNALKAQQANQSSVLPAAREAQWLATKQALQTAGWNGRYGDDPSGQGLAALGVKLSPEDQAALPLLMDEGPVDPSLDALTPAQRQQLALQWQTNQTQKQAAAKADLAGLQQRLDDMMLTGMLDGPPPKRQLFVDALGPEDGGRSFDTFNETQALAPGIAWTLHQPDATQDATLALYDGSTDPRTQRIYSLLQGAVQRMRTERRTDPVGVIGKLSPDIGQAWQALEGADPTTLQRKLPGLVNQTAEALDRTGVPDAERQYLPKSMASDIVATFDDPTRSIPDRLAGVSRALLATDVPDRQRGIFSQLVKAGLPQMMQPVAGALGRGDRDAALRLTEAIAAPADATAGAGSTPSATNVSAESDAWDKDRGQGAVLDIQAAPRWLAERARTDVLLLGRAARQEMSRNGGDLVGASDRAGRDIFGNDPMTTQSQAAWSDIGKDEAPEKKSTVDDQSAISRAPDDGSATPFVPPDHAGGAYLHDGKLYLSPKDPGMPQVAIPAPPPSFKRTPLEYTLNPDYPVGPSSAPPVQIYSKGFTANDWYFHTYHVADDGKPISGPDAARYVGDALATYATPTSTEPATENGVKNPVGPLPDLGSHRLMKYQRWLLPGQNWVYSYRVPSPDPTKFTDVTINYTAPGKHLIDEGYVMRVGIMQPDGSVVPRIYGEGHAFLQDKYLSFLWKNDVQRVWKENLKKVDAYAREKIQDNLP